VALLLAVGNRELSIKLMDLLSKWMKNCTSMEEIQELIGMEQFLNMLPENEQQWAIEQNPKTCIQAWELKSPDIALPHRYLLDVTFEKGPQTGHCVLIHSCCLLVCVVSVELNTI
jgi:hypothetical protein